MPWELIPKEPAPYPPLAALTSERREVLRKAIGEEAIQHAQTLLDTLSPVSADSQLIRLHESGLHEDLKHDWLAAPVLALFDGLWSVLQLDLNDNTAVGTALRGEVRELLSRADTVAELVAFFDLFDPSILHELVVHASRDALGMAMALTSWLTADTDDQSADAADTFAELAEEASNDQKILFSLPYTAQIVGSSAPVTYEDEFETLLGIAYPAEATRRVEVYRSLESAGYDLCDLGSRQLAYVGPYQATDRIWSRNFFELGLRIGQSAYPLLAHRGAYLTWQLIQAAVSTDTKSTFDAIHALLGNESPWMIDAHVDYEEARQRYLTGDPAAIIQAHVVLTEGTFRRYASLVVALERIVTREQLQSPLVFATTGDVEDQLGVWKERPLPSLLLRFVERRLRNAGAHANVVVMVGGTLNVRLQDGTSEEFDPNLVYGRTAGLRSLLDGVDIAMNHASIRDNEVAIANGTRTPTMPPSAHVFERVVQQFAEEHTSGAVSDVERRGGVLNVTYHGEPEYNELKAFADSLTGLLMPDLPEIHVFNDRGEPIEVFKPPVIAVGRNEPCPCGSGKKYKRCHGA